MSDDFNSNYPFPSGAAPDNEPESLPPIRLKIPDYEEEEEEESEEEEVNYRSQRVAVAAFNTRSEDYERRSQLAAEALSEEKARRRAESFSGTKRILLSFAVGIGVILALWLFIQSRTHQKNDADTHKVSFYYAVTEENAGVIAHIFTKIPEITKSLGLENGYRIVNNCGEHGCQSVKHMHFHILGGTQLGGRMT